MTQARSTPKISVLITTYNHGQFIRDCIQSALAQQTTFDYEIVVGEDCSTDDTRAVVEDFARTNPDRIVPLYQPKNTGGHGNFLSCLERCRGEWIAWLEGDDLWTDPLKLQKQIDALTADPSLVLCFANGRAFISGTDVGSGELLVDRRFFRAGLYDKQKIIYGNFIPTCTVVFKKAAVWPLPSWYSELPLGDWSLTLLALSKGAALFIDEEMAGYRRHATGAWSLIGAAKTAERMVVVCTRLKREMPSWLERRKMSSTLSIWLFRRGLARLKAGEHQLAIADLARGLVAFLQSDWWSLQRASFLLKKAYFRLFA